MFDNLTDKLDRAFKLIKGEGKITEINVAETLKEVLGRGRAKSGMFEGNVEDGELEIGQASALIGDIKPAGEIVREIIREYNEARTGLQEL